MAELLAYDSSGAALKDTFRGQVIVSIISDKNYVYKDIDASFVTKEVRTPVPIGFIQPDLFDPGVAGERNVSTVASNILDGSGLSVRDETGVHTGGDNNSQVWVSATGTAWQNAITTLTFNTPQNIDVFYMWGRGNPYSGSTIQNFTLTFRDGLGVIIGAVEPFTAIDKGADHTAQIFNFTVREGVEVVELVIIDAYSATTAAISEVGFRGNNIEVTNPALYNIPIVNDLTSGGEDAILSAEMGVELLKEVKQTVGVTIQAGLGADVELNTYKGGLVHLNGQSGNTTWNVADESDGKRFQIYETGNVAQTITIVNATAVYLLNGDIHENIVDGEIAIGVNEKWLITHTENGGLHFINAVRTDKHNDIIYHDFFNSGNIGTELEFTPISNGLYYFKYSGGVIEVDTGSEVYGRVAMSIGTTTAGNEILEFTDSASSPKIATGNEWHSGAEKNYLFRKVTIGLYLQAGTTYYINTQLSSCTFGADPANSIPISFEASPLIQLPNISVTDAELTTFSGIDGAMFYNPLSKQPMLWNNDKWSPFTATLIKDEITYEKDIISNGIRLTKRVFGVKKIVLLLGSRGGGSARIWQNFELKKTGGGNYQPVADYTVTITPADATHGLVDPVELDNMLTGGTGNDIMPDNSYGYSPGLPFGEVTLDFATSVIDLSEITLEGNPAGDFVMFGFTVFDEVDNIIFTEPNDRNYHLGIVSKSIIPANDYVLMNHIEEGGIKKVQITIDGVEVFKVSPTGIETPTVGAGGVEADNLTTINTETGVQELSGFKSGLIRLLDNNATWDVGAETDGKW